MRKIPQSHHIKAGNRCHSHGRWERNTQFCQHHRAPKWPRTIYMLSTREPVPTGWWFQLKTVWPGALPTAAASSKSQATQPHLVPVIRALLPWRRLKEQPQDSPRGTTDPCTVTDVRAFTDCRWTQEPLPMSIHLCVYAPDGHKHSTHWLLFVFQSMASVLQWETSAWLWHISPGFLGFVFVIILPGRW